ncbi:aminoglycoside phosphotransferase [Bacillus freudenreichii]|nr:aminoglycoside phosphotransferase [Bacillus freudenreichii]
MTNIFNQRDGFNSRLLLYVKRTTGINFHKISEIKKGVWIVFAKNERWVIKEFTNPDKLKQQILLTNLLWKHGFKNTYRFHRIHDSGPCYFEKRCLGVLQYVEPNNGKSFQFDTAKNRSEAIELLCHFHSVSAKCMFVLKDKLPTFNLLEKWEKRLETFKRNCQEIKESSIYPYLEKYIQVGELSLNVMKAHETYFFKKPHCILHGDLAHHNFLRKNDGSLYLIDFDLISIGPKHIDILQYCNRILPSIGWSPERLFAEGDAIGQYGKDTPFLAALLYPADIFREWNYFFSYDKKKQKKHWKHLKEITFRQFEKRMQFSTWMINRMESDLL